MSPDQPALVLVAGAWAYFSATIAAYREVNAKRDIIVVGFFEGHPNRLAREGRPQASVSPARGR